MFDLKAVNPNALVKIDTRTSEEVIESIADQSKIVSQALAADQIMQSLKKLLLEVSAHFAGFSPGSFARMRSIASIIPRIASGG